MTLFLPRFHWMAPGDFLNFSSDGASTLITSAPKSDITMVAMPPGIPLVKSRTVMPSKTCAITPLLIRVQDSLILGVVRSF